MQLQGKIKLIKDLEVVSDRFSKRDFVLETDLDREYTQKIILQCGNDRASLLDVVRIGEMVTVHFNITGREYERDGKINYFNQLSCWKIDREAGASNQPAQKTSTATQDKDDLPF